MTRATAAGDLVVRGRDGRLFLGCQDSYSLEAFCDGSLLPQAALWRWRQTVMRRTRELAAIGIPYVFLIVPDAPSVYPEDLPDGMGEATRPSTSPSMPVGARLCEQLRGIPNLTVVYPLQAMLAAKGGLPLYRKTDTHWSGFGAYVGYRAFCQAVAPLLPLHPVPPRAVRYAVQREYGDLGILLDPEEAGFNTAMRLEEGAYTRLYLRVGPERTNTQVFRCATAPETAVLIMRDSFMTEQAPLMARSFGTTEMVGTTSRLFMDHVLATRPDMVVTEICERRLGEWESDHQIAGFDDLFGTDWVSDAGRDVLAVEMALRQGQANAAADAAAALVAAGGVFAPGSLLMPGHALTLGRALIGGQRAADADRLLAAALAATPDRVSLRLAAAQARFVMNDGVAALSMTYAVREMAPWNGYAHELLVYMLLAFNRVKEARAAFALAADRMPDHPSLFLLGSQAAERDGERPAALEAMARAARLWPDNAEFQARLADLRAAAGAAAALAPELVEA
ncbi:MAG: alginate O-acetyltransferase AlgX-related protein [Janthinobacterium lividum]